MSSERAALIVYVNLDPMPGTFHSKESARNVIHGILEERIGHYAPMVSIAPVVLQPEDSEVLPDYNPADIDASMSALDFLTKYNIEGTN